MRNSFFDFAADDQKRVEIARDQDAFFSGAYTAYQREVHDPCLTFADFLDVVCSRGELHKEAV